MVIVKCICQLRITLAQVYVNLQESCAIADYRLNPLPLHDRAIASISENSLS
ncbi:MAG: hypothetical protein ICV85_07265 [Tolypothrix sp. T3-bin4]|nr:hypothetical protein [Tolypothrix sp. T3-bin4]